MSLLDSIGCLETSEFNDGNPPSWHDNRAATPPLHVGSQDTLWQLLLVPQRQQPADSLPWPEIVTRHKHAMLSILKRVDGVRARNLLIDYRERDMNTTGHR